MQIGLIALDDHEHQTMEHEDESSLRFWCASYGLIKLN